tara:strand:+ start:1119 stop:1295 length:177 start_codon:yes stop_codon:yes gene_type:complete
MEDIPEKLNLIKEVTKLTNTKCMERLIKDTELRDNSFDKKQSVESIRLEEILNELNFD